MAKFTSPGHGVDISEPGPPVMRVPDVQLKVLRFTRLEQDRGGW
jgi:hypothetical protein